MDVNLVLFKKNGSHRAFSLPSNVTVIGRRQDCDLCIPLMSVSRKHCQLNYNDGALKIRDLGSRNGTYINGKRIDEAIGQPGDYLKIGPLTFLLQINGRPEEIVPPDRAAQRLPQQEAPAIKATADEDSFAELEFDESDSSLAELEDI